MPRTTRSTNSNSGSNRRRPSTRHSNNLRAIVQDPVRSKAPNRNRRSVGGKPQTAATNSPKTRKNLRSSLNKKSQNSEIQEIKKLLVDVIRATGRNPVANKQSNRKSGNSTNNTRRNNTSTSSSKNSRGKNNSTNSRRNPNNSKSTRNTKTSSGKSKTIRSSKVTEESLDHDLDAYKLDRSELTGSERLEAELSNVQRPRRGRRT